MENHYYFERCDAYSKERTTEIVEWLQQWHSINRVEDNPNWQTQHIDLFTMFVDEGKLRLVTLEVKVDSHYYSANYFAERIANTKKNSLGCWFTTKSDYILYYFPEVRELHILPTKETQQWTCRNMDFLKMRKAATVSDSGRVLYHTKGFLIPRGLVRKEVPIDIYKI